MKLGWALVMAAGFVIAFTAGSWPLKAIGIFVAVASGLIVLRDEVVAEIERRKSGLGD